MKAFASLVKMITDGENNFIKNICNKWMRYRNISPNQKKKSTLGSSTIYLLCVNIIEIANSKLIIQTYFLSAMKMYFYMI